MVYSTSCTTKAGAPLVWTGEHPHTSPPLAQLNPPIAHPLPRRAKIEELSTKLHKEVRSMIDEHLQQYGGADNESGKGVLTEVLRERGLLTSDGDVNAVRNRL